MTTAAPAAVSVAAKNRMRPETRFRRLYLVWRIVFGLVTIWLAASLLLAAKGGQPLLKNQSVFLSTVFWFIYLFLCLWARDQASKEQARHPLPLASMPPKPRRQAFFWQGVLILLPVALMAGFGFWAILRERNAADQEAQQRAREIVSSFSDKFGREVADGLTSATMALGSLNSPLTGASVWPTTTNRIKWIAVTNEFKYRFGAGRDLQAHPLWTGGPFSPVEFWAHTNWDTWDEYADPPHPPAWLLGLSDKQFQAWTALEAACARPTPLPVITNLVNAFRQTGPPEAARVCANFYELCAVAATLPDRDAVDKLLRYGRRDRRYVSPEGLPLATLAIAGALRHADATGPSKPLWDALQDEVSWPTPLTSALLDDAARLAANDDRLTDSIQELRNHFAYCQAKNELLETIRMTGGPAWNSNTSLWIMARSEKWFCILGQPDITSNRGATNMVAETDVQCFPQPLVAMILAQTLADAKISIPDYFGISFKQEKTPIPLPPPWNSTGTRHPAGELLAEGRFQLSQRAGTTVYTPNGPSHDVFFEDMPSHPQFTVQVLLTDRTRLYAHQRELQWIFGTLIGTSTVAALIGFVSAFRAFRRQQELTELKSNFVSSVSHELRAPIASVRLMAENLAGGKIPEAGRQMEYFSFIVQECRRLSSLIENVLDFSRIDQGRKQYEFEPTDLRALALTTVKLMEPYAHEKGVKLQWTAAESGSAPVEMDIDGRAIQQALVNLIDNAIKHSPGGEAVTIGLDLKPGSARPCVHLYVTDHGPGIPAAEQERIFERFYRLGSELRRETQGIGIGLSIVKHVVEAHHGRVIVQSRPGQGSRFTLELPARRST